MIQVIKRGWMFQAEWLFEPRDLWVGAYWKRYPAGLQVYICLLPALPVSLYWQHLRYAQPETAPEQS